MAENNTKMSRQRDDNFFGSENSLKQKTESIRSTIIDNLNEKDLDGNISKFFTEMTKCKSLNDSITQTSIDEFFDETCKIITKVNNCGKSTKDKIIAKYSNIVKAIESLLIRKIPKLNDGFDNLVTLLRENNGDKKSSSSSKLPIIREQSEEDKLRLAINSADFNRYNNILYPCKREYLDVFIQNFKALGEAKDTGSFVDSIEKKQESYLKALVYYYKNEFKMSSSELRRLDGSDITNRFILFFVGKARELSLAFIMYVFDNLASEIEDNNQTPVAVAVRNFMNDVNNNRILIEYIKKSEPLRDDDGFYIVYKDVNKEDSELDDRHKEIVINKENKDGKIVSTIKRRINKSDMKYLLGIFIVLSVPMDEVKLSESCKSCFDDIIKPGDKNFTPYWWQKLCIEYATEGKNLIIAGPTSGGKTHNLLYISAKIIMKLTGKGRNLVVCCLPTKQLAFQIYANMIETFPKLNNTIGILTETFKYIPNSFIQEYERSMIIIGTPKEIRDYLVRRNSGAFVEQDYAQKINRYAAEKTLQRIDRLIIDEVHTLSEDYSFGSDEANNAKATEELIGCVDSENGQIICASASLSDLSKKRLEENIRRAMNGGTNTRNTEIMTVSYRLEDIGEYEKPTEYKFPELPQVRFPVCVNDSGVIYKATESEELNREIEITPQFLLSLLLKGKAERVLPMALFFMAEQESVRALSSLIQYFKSRTNASEWMKIKNGYDAMCLKQTIDATEEYYKEYLENEIIKKSKIVVNDIPIPIELFSGLVRKFERYSGKKLTQINYSADLYAFLYEYVNKREGKPFFVSDVHPLFLFGKVKVTNKDNRFRMTREDGSDSDFAKKLKSQNVNIANCAKLIELISDSFKHGIGLSISTIPVAFQVEIAKILKEVKEESSKVKIVNSSSSSDEDDYLDLQEIGAVFCDYQMASGVDYSFKSSAIIFYKLVPLMYSVFLQMNGRSGRFSRNLRKLSELPKSMTFTVNVKNTLTFNNSIEDMNFTSRNNKTDFYESNTVYDVLKNMIKKTDPIINKLKKDEKFNDVFPEDGAIFPGVLDINETHLKYALMAREMNEIYDITKTAAPSIASDYVEYLFYYFQLKSYSTLMESI